MKNKELKKYIASLEIFDKRFVNPNEEYNESDDNVIKDGGCTYIIDDKGLTDDEVKIALLATQTRHIQTIKNVVVFSFLVSSVSFVIIIISIM